MARRVLIFGAGGQLGRTLGEVFKRRQWQTIGADPFLRPTTAEVLKLDPKTSTTDQCNSLLVQVKDILKDSRLDAVVNVAGGFAMGSAGDSGMVEATVKMVESSVYTSVMSAHVSSLHLKAGGLLVLPGAAAALSPTSWSLPYGTAKVAVHHLVRSLADAEAAGLPAGVKTVGLAPTIMDTPQNRDAMPDADRSGWATLDEVAEQLEAWCADPAALKSGQVYVVNKAQGAPASFDPKDPI